MLLFLDLRSSSKYVVIQNDGNVNNNDDDEKKEIKTNILAGVYFIFLKERPRPKLESLATPNLDLVK